MCAKGMAWTLLTTLVLAWPAGAAEMRGVITRIDPEKKELVVEGRSPGARGLALAFQLEPETQVLFGQQRGQVGELAPGKRAHVFYEVRAGQRVATLITVAGSRPTASRPSDGNQSSGILRLLPRAGLSPAVPTPSEGNLISGILRRISITEREITVVGPGRSAAEEIETVLRVPPDVQITKDQTVVKLDDLKEGDTVQVRSEKSDGKLVARSIQVGALGTVRPPEPSRVERLREVLKMVDGLLQLAEQRRQGNP